MSWRSNITDETHFTQCSQFISCDINAVDLEEGPATATAHLLTPASPPSSACMGCRRGVVRRGCTLQFSWITFPCLSVSVCHQRP
jgi:hypothetical protein